MGPVRFLFVDDEQPILNVLERALKSEGFAMFFTADPKKAIDLVKEHDIEVVICDHMMPGLKGVDVLALVRASAAHIIRVLVSGSPERSVDDGAVERYVEKPWQLAELKAMLHEVEAEALARRASRR
jgi:CheY-like chemotaxis protein